MSYLTPVKKKFENKINQIKRGITRKLISLYNFKFSFSSFLFPLLGLAKTEVHK